MMKSFIPHDCRSTTTTSLLLLLVGPTPVAVLTSASGTESVRPTPTVVGPTIVILVLRPSICHQYTFLDIQMIGTCSMRLVCRFCCWPTSQCQTCTGYRTWYHEHDRDDGRQAQGQSSRARPRPGKRPGKHVFVAYKNPFIFAVFECTN